MNTLKIKLCTDSKTEATKLMSDMAAYASQLVHIEIQPDQDEESETVGVYAILRDEPAALNAIVTDLLTKKAEFIVSISQEQPNQPNSSEKQSRRSFG